MLVKYWLPVAVLVIAQVAWTSWASSDESKELATEGSREVGESSDLEAQELFLRPVVIKYGHDNPAVYTWQGGSGMGKGWGVYQNTGLQLGGQGGSGWPKKKGWGKDKKKKKKKKKKAKKKKKPKKKKNKAWGKKKEKKKGGGGDGWGEGNDDDDDKKGGKKKGGGGGGWGEGDDDDDDKKGGKKKGGGGWGDDDDDEGGGWGEGKKKKKKKEKKKKGGEGGWGDDDDDDGGGGWERRRNDYEFTFNQGVQRFGGGADTVQYIPVVPADALPFQGFDGYYQDAYMR